MQGRDENPLREAFWLISCGPKLKVNVQFNVVSTLDNDTSVSHSVLELPKSIMNSDLEVLSWALSVDEEEREYRVRIGDQIKYLFVNPGTYHGDILPFPPRLIQTRT